MLLSFSGFQHGVWEAALQCLGAAFAVAEEAGASKQAVQEAEGAGLLN